MLRARSTSGIRSNRRLGDAEVDSLEEAHVLDVLPATLADNRQNAEVIAIVEDGCHVIGDREIGRVLVPDTMAMVLELIRSPIVPSSGLLGKGAPERFCELAGAAKKRHHNEYKVA